MEALHNYTACVFQIRPWDWSGILLQRICHECAYFCHVVDDDGQQRNLLEKFIDEGLAKHRQNLIQGKPPLVYAELMSVAKTVVLNYNGRSYNLFRKIDCYGSYRMVKITELNNTLSHKNSISSANKIEGVNGGGGRGGARGWKEEQETPWSWQARRRLQ